MFKLHLDLHVHFVPPMHGHGAGVVLTRETELPFVPTEGLRLFSRTFEGHSDPMGFMLESVVWDIDRQVFLASTDLVVDSVPLPFIADEIRSWVERGWRFASYRDDYPTDDAEGPDAVAADSDVDAEGNEWDDAEKAHLRSWQQRSAEQNRILKALIRHMAETYDNEAAAYAFDRTGRYFTEQQIKESRLDDRNIRKFVDATREFENMPFAQQQSWRDRTERYPSFEEFLPGQT